MEETRRGSGSCMACFRKLEKSVPPTCYSGTSRTPSADRMETEVDPFFKLFPSFWSWFETTVSTAFESLAEHQHITFHSNDPRSVVKELATHLKDPHIVGPNQRTGYFPNQSFYQIREVMNSVHHQSPKLVFGQLKAAIDTSASLLEELAASAFILESKVPQIRAEFEKLSPFSNRGHL